MLANSSKISYLTRFFSRIVSPNNAFGVEVLVDTETAQVSVEKAVGAFDMGFPINPKLCEGQIEGGLGMAIGATILEEYVYDGDECSIVVTGITESLPWQNAIERKCERTLCSRPLARRALGSKGHQ